MVPFLGHDWKIRERVFYLLHVCLCVCWLVCTQGTIRLLLGGFTWNMFWWFLKVCRYNSRLMYVCMYVGCPESIQPFWISREPLAWSSCNLAGVQRRPYCPSVKSHCPVGLVIRQWDAIDWACVLCDRRIQQWPSEQISFITTMRLPILQHSCRLFWQSITSTRSVSPPTAQFWLPATSGFSQS